MIVHSDILLIEDSESDIELTRMAFERGNIRYSLESVRDTQEALDYLSSSGSYSDKDVHQLPKLILLDILMRDGIGWEILRYLKSHDHTMTIPVVIISDMTEEQADREGNPQSADGYLLKPFLFQIFVKLLQQMTALWLSPMLPVSL